MERMIEDALNGGIRTDRACMLVVGPKSTNRQSLVDHVEEMGHVCLVTSSIDEAWEMLEAHDAIDVVLVDGQACSRESLRLVRDIQANRSWVRAMVWSDSLDPQLTVDAIRDGASDFLVLPADFQRLNQRIEQLLERVRAARENEQRMVNLLDACRELSESRDEMSEQVDVLCSDLASAYRTMRDQVTDAVMVSEFKTLISQDLDVEDMLRTALEYMLRRLGPTNAVVYLPESSERFGIGAYVNYDMTDRDPMPLYRALGEAICPPLQQESGLVRYEDAEAWARDNGLDATMLANTQVVAFACKCGSETLAIMTFFRSADTPFEDSVAGMLDSLRTVLGEQLGRIVRIHRRGQDEWPKDNDGDGQTGMEFDPGSFTDDQDGSEWGDLAA
ncbi:MAG: response regulator [Phycisphaerales bacterium]|nr:response regulator [Phycisphaerales bacterium]